MGMFDYVDFEMAKIYYAELFMNATDEVMK